MRLSVIIVNYRSWASLGTALQALSGVSDPTRLDYEIIVVDNDSADGLLDEYRNRFPEVTFHVAAGNRGFAHACNLGAAKASGELLLFLNPDVRATPDELARLVDERTTHRAYAIMTACQSDARGRPHKVCGGFPALMTSVPALRALLRTARPVRGSSALPLACDWVSGSVLLISRTDLGRLAGWNEKFWLYYEDVDLCLRASRLGMRAACTTALSLRHDHGGASRRDEETSILTRTEVIISRHVYVQENFAGAYRVAFHASLLIREITALGLCALADLLTLSQLTVLRLRSGVLKGLLTHLVGAARRRSWQSPRAPG